MSDTRLLAGLRDEFRQTATIYLGAKHSFIDGNLSELPDWLGVKLMEHLHIATTTKFSSLHLYSNFVDDDANNKMRAAFNALANKAAAYAGLEKTGPIAWLELVYKILEDSHPNLVQKGYCVGLPMRALAINPFEASAIAIDEICNHTMTVKEAADKLGISETSITRQCKKKIIPAIRGRNGQWHIPCSWVEQQTPTTKRPKAKKLKLSSPVAWECAKCGNIVNSASLPSKCKCGRPVYTRQNHKKAV